MLEIHLNKQTNKRKKQMDLLLILDAGKRKKNSGQIANGGEMRREEKRGMK